MYDDIAVFIDAAQKKIAKLLWHTRIEARLDYPSTETGLIALCILIQKL